ncbi:MAG: hypothetical protein GY927_15520 [bacterium]|nr:hypothetical protein [bacterium]
MKLSDKQFEFAKTMSLFEVWLARHFKYVRGEALRSRPEAQRLAKLGLGIVNSNHCLKLAQDLIIFDENGDPWNDEVYKFAADKWIKMHPLARAGYYFKGRGKGPGRDGPHFSFIHNGVQ